MHCHTSLCVHLVLDCLYIFLYAPGISASSCHLLAVTSPFWFLPLFSSHFSLQSVLHIAVFLGSLQIISDISYATLQDLWSVWGSLLFRLRPYSEFFFTCCFLYLGESCCYSPVLLYYLLPVLLHSSWKSSKCAQYFILHWKYSCCLIDLENFILNN